MEFVNFIIYIGGWRPYLFSYECIWDVLQSRKKVKQDMSCCDDPTAHHPQASTPTASTSALKALTTSGESIECPDPVVAAAMLEATQLTDNEREIILGVLGRDELLRRDQQLRVLQLKAELQNLRRKGALKPTTNLDTTGPDQDPDRYCRRCRVELGRVINRGSYCRACRLKVCKACREFSLRTTDWVCTVCKKQMEIQAASGEWMNEFVKRPNKRRENRVYLPTADIIRRTIRRSWTISNPTPRWSTMRGSPELRPYNSLPRKQDINNYPSLVLFQANLKNQEISTQENPSPTFRRRSPRRTQSEDIYDDQGSTSQFKGTSPITHPGNSPDVDIFSHRPSRINPLIKLADGRPDIERRRSPMRRSNDGSSEDGSSKEDGSPKSKGILTPETARKFDRNNIEKRVSFESHTPYTKMMSRPAPVLRTQSLIEGRIQNHIPNRYPAHHEDNSDNSEEAAHGDAQDSREENNPIELCEIEPFSGTVFRKMMVRRRRQNNARNISGSTSNCSTAENGWRRGPDSDLWDILLPEGDDYKLVFINSDGSSKEETSSREEDDNDSSSTASSFPIDECDWDYFEPGSRPAPVINWSSPFGSPRVYRRSVVESPIGSPLVYRRLMRESDTGTDEDNVRQDTGSPASSDSIFQPRILSEEPPFDTIQQRNDKMEDTAALQCVHSEDVSTKPSCHACGAPTQFIPIPVPVPIPFPVPTLWSPHEPPLMVFGEQRFRVLPRNLWPYLSQAALIWPTLNANGGTTGTTMPATTDRDTCALETHKEPDNVLPVVEAEEEITGYLDCENRYASSSDSSSDSSDNSEPRVRRMYNVSGTERHSDDALPSSNVSSDNDEEDGRMSHSSVREDDMTSSGSADTDSDDTGTVADQKSKRFSRKFVVNKNLSSSSCSSSSQTDTSDNDTDTELDCTVILTNVKQLEEEKYDVCDKKSSDKTTEKLRKQQKNEYYFSSPGLSDVSAESVNSSDVDQTKDYNNTSKDLISKENNETKELTENVNLSLSKSDVQNNICKNKHDATRKKKVCFDDVDTIEKEIFTDEVAVIKLSKRDIEAIKRENVNELPFGNEFNLSQAVHFKINKDEVDESNVNKEDSLINSLMIPSSSSSSCLVKSEENKNRDIDSIERSQKADVTFSLFEKPSKQNNEKDNKAMNKNNSDDIINICITVGTTEDFTSKNKENENDEEFSKESVIIESITVEEMNNELESNISVLEQNNNLDKEDDAVEISTTEKEFNEGDEKEPPQSLDEHGKKTSDENVDIDDEYDYETLAWTLDTQTTAQKLEKPQDETEKEDGTCLASGDLETAKEFSESQEKTGTESIIEQFDKISSTLDDESDQTSTEYFDADTEYDTASLGDSTGTQRLSSIESSDTYKEHDTQYSAYSVTQQEITLALMADPRNIRNSFEKVTRAASPGVKFELKPYDEGINIFGENTDDDIEPESEYNMLHLGYGTVRTQDTMISKNVDDNCVTISEYDKLSIPTHSGVKFELKPFDTETINIFGKASAENTDDNIESDSETNMLFLGHSALRTQEKTISKNTDDENEYDKLSTPTLSAVKFELKPYDPETINIFGKTSAENTDRIIENESEVNTLYWVHGALRIKEKTILKNTDDDRITQNECDRLNIPTYSDIKFESKPFDTELIRICGKTSTENTDVNIEIESEYNTLDLDHDALRTQEKTISKNTANENKYDKLSTPAHSDVKFELKPYDPETINIFGSDEDTDDNSEIDSDSNTPYLGYGDPPNKKKMIFKNTDDDHVTEIEFDKLNTPTHFGVKFELKSFDTETMSIFEESNNSVVTGKTVALKDLDIIKNKQDLRCTEYSNRPVIYSSTSFGNSDIDISKRHEIIQSFDKTGRITDCTVDVKSENDDDVDNFKNLDKINLAENFQFTLRSYNDDKDKELLAHFGKIRRDSSTSNIIERIFKRKRNSDNDKLTTETTDKDIDKTEANTEPPVESPPQQEIDRFISEMVEAISSEYSLISNINCPTTRPTDNDQLMDAVVGEETPVESVGADDQRALSEWNEIRSIDAVNVEGNSLHDRNDGVQPGAIVCGEVLSRHAARYTSLVMITQDPAPNYQQVSVVTSDTTTLVPGNDVIVRHTNWQEDENKHKEKIRDNQNQERESVTVITGGDTLSAFEEGLADDDSWVENLSHDEDEDEFATNSGTEDSSSGEEVTLTCSAAMDQEEDLRGYHRTAIDFTLHTIVEESCEESEVEQNVPKKKERPASATDLEKYFFFGLGDGMGPSLQSNRDDAFSETSSIYSEGMESLGSEEVQTPNDNSDPAELASSRLEKYFLSGFMGFTAERRDSDGSVGSDSEGRPSPEQRRKRLVRARGTGRSHSSSLDNLDNAISEQTIESQMSSEHSSSSDSENYDETNSFEKPDGQFDTVKRKKNKKHKNASSADESKNLETTQEIEEKRSESDEDGHKTPQPEVQSPISNLTTTKNQQSRDSGFVGSCDDLLREQRDNNTPDFTSVKNELIKTELEDITEEKKVEEKLISNSTPPATSLTRKDSFNNWSSDEETNLMMCKMRQFFKTMVANSQLNASSKPSTPNLSCTIKPLPSPRAKRCKPPQLVYFENELTRLMKTVPGIREDQVREIVEYLSSEDTWSDSYDSSDYTSSDLEISTSKTVLQQQISDSCKQIINKFDNRVDDEGDEGDGGIIDESHGLNKETAFVYQKLVASFEKMAAGENCDNNIPKVAPHSSPPLIAKVMHHIGSRLVALMHEVSSGESHASNSPKTKHYHRRLQHKISSASSTTTEDDCPDGAGDIIGYEEHVPYNLLPRSRSHDLLVGEARILHQSTSGVSDITEEKEASDCERFSWRGSFESALLATDSRNRLSLLGGEASASASALAIAAKRRSAGDLLFSNKSLSREQLDRVRSCGSIGGANSEDKLWVASAIRPNRRRSSVPDATCGSGGSADGEDEDEDIESRSTLPRSLQGGTPTTNSLPRLPTTVSSSSIQKSQSHHFLSQNVKSARYRPPGFNRLTSMPKRAVSAPGLQPSHQRRGRRSQQNNVPNDEAGVSEAHSSPMLASPRNGTKSATTSPVTSGSKRVSHDWHEEDLDRITGLQGRASLSTLGARSDSMASVYSGAGEGRYGSVAVRGQVEFGLQYNYKAGALEIQIKQCRDLAPVDTKRNRSDPYVKVYLLPDKSKSGKRKTKVKKHTLNPVFDECLKFHISLNGLETRTLWLTVWHSDMFGRNDFLGEVMMTLENKVFDDPTPKWYNLQERTEPFEDVPSYKGDIIVCLKFVPPDMTVQKKGKRSRGALHVLIKEAKALTAVKANGTSDPFCKSYLLPDKGRSSKQKTPIARRTTNPVWNYTFVYDDVSLQELAERCLELTVWDHDRLASNEFLGGVRFSLGTGKHYGKPVDWMDASGREMSLWKNMLEKPNFWVEGSLSLRSSLESRGS